MSTSSAMSAAFEVLLEEVESEIASVNQEGSAAFAAGDHARAAQALERAQQLSALQQRLNALEEQFAGLLRPAGDAPAPGGKLPHGLKTPQTAYRRPILRALVDLGGAGNIDAVLQRVWVMMKEQLNAYDLAPLPSDESQIRWRNTAQWARNSMRMEGLLKADSPHGVWEITEKGRRAVEEGRAT